MTKYAKEGHAMYSTGTKPIRTNVEHNRKWRKNEKKKFTNVHTHSVCAMLYVLREKKREKPHERERIGVAMAKRKKNERTNDSSLSFVCRSFFYALNCQHSGGWQVSVDHTAPISILMVGVFSQMWLRFSYGRHVHMGVCMCVWVYAATAARWWMRLSNDDFSVQYNNYKIKQNFHSFDHQRYVHCTHTHT